VAVIATIIALAPGEGVAVFGPPPEPRATAYALVDPATGETLAAESPDRTLPMASPTKMMTALLVRDRADLDELVTILDTDLDDDVVPTLVPGERLPVRDLLASLLVGSDNRAAVALAVHVAGSEERFVALMNARARAADLAATRFANPHGLDAPNHRSSAADLVTIAEEVMADPFLADIVGERTAAIPGPGGVGTRALESQNDLLDLDPEADGVKTGMTSDAGYVLVAHATRSRLDKELYVAILGSPGRLERAADAEALLDWGFAQFARPTLVDPAEELGQVAVTGRPGRVIALRTARPLEATVRVDEGIEQRVRVPPRLDPPLAAGERVGEVVYLQSGRELARAPVVLAGGAGAPTLWDRVRSGWDELIP